MRVGERRRAVADAHEDVVDGVLRCRTSASKVVRGTRILLFHIHGPSPPPKPGLFLSTPTTVHSTPSTVMAGSSSGVGAVEAARATTLAPTTQTRRRSRRSSSVMKRPVADLEPIAATAPSARRRVERRCASSACGSSAWSSDRCSLVTCAPGSTGEPSSVSVVAAGRARAASSASAWPAARRGRPARGRRRWRSDRGRAAPPAPPASSDASSTIEPAPIMMPSSVSAVRAAVGVEGVAHRAELIDEPHHAPRIAVMASSLAARRAGK